MIQCRMALLCINVKNSDFPKLRVGSGSGHFAESGSESRLLLNPDSKKIRIRTKVFTKITNFISKTVIFRYVLVKDIHGNSSHSEIASLFPNFDDNFGLPGSGSNPDPKH